MYELSDKFEYRLYIIKNMVHELLFFVPRSIPEFTDHGVRHSERIEQIIRNLLIPICNKSVDTELNEYECFCLIASCWLHDLGCIISRENHGIRSAQIVNEHLSHLFRGIDNLEPYILKIISTHTDSDEDKKNGTMSLSNLIDEVEIETIGPDIIDKTKIKVKLIASLFRLADACDICMDRAPSLVYKLIEEDLPEPSKKIWRAHLEITKISINSQKKAFYIIVDNASIGKPVIDKFKKDVDELKFILNSLNFYYTEVEVIEIGGPDWKNI